MIVLMTGGSGTLAKALVPLLVDDARVRRVRLLSRNEPAQLAMKEHLRKSSSLDKIDLFVGDVRDLDRICHASDGADWVIHAAAMKQVPLAEYDPEECIKTNIHGTLNVIEACHQNNVDKAIFTSSDKCVEPLNFYGATKMVAELLFVAGNRGNHRTRFSCVRYGNVYSSNMSVVTKWMQQMRDKRPLTITEENMTRFFMSPKNAAEFIFNGLNRMQGAETYIPKMKSTSMIELLTVFKGANTNSPVSAIGRRPGEKQHEMLVSPNESELITDVGWAYIRWPWAGVFPVPKIGRPVDMKEGFTSSGAERFSIEELELFCREAE